MIILYIYFVIRKVGGIKDVSWQI